MVWYSALSEKAGVHADSPTKLLIVPVSSDRGLCGAIHSGLSKAIRFKIADLPEVGDAVAVGMCLSVACRLLLGCA
jgi:F-type H+-transporting ATPase subunit gamma